MNKLSQISVSIRALRELLKKEFRTGLQNYIVGETLSLRDGKLVIGSNLYKRWLSKIRTKGFDYEIGFKR